ncbi:MAG: hypothetical protein D6800_03775 [Candidatus Zixiibacteriota bacterium]|nr:MAG: hypothetical protein D6800_03775 [candidate division Zixibacteria bacterium]
MAEGARTGAELETDAQEIGLADIVEILRRYRRLIGRSIAVALLLGVAYALLATPRYTATVVVQPVEEQAGGAASALAGKFGGLASLAGINLGGGGNKEEYLAILRSRELAEKFIRSQDVAPKLMPALWDEESKTWKAKPPWTTWLKRRLRGMLATISGDAGWRERHGAEPTMGELYRKFDEKLRAIDEDLKTGLVSVSFTLEEPELASRWVNDYVAKANEEIRARTIREAEAAVTYLKAEADRTNDMQLKNAIFDLIQSQMQRIATAKARPEYAFRVIDPAVVPEKPSRPRRILAIFLALIGGTALALGIIVWKESAASVSREEQQAGRVGA